MSARTLLRETDSSYRSRNRQDIVDLDAFQRSDPSISADGNHNEGKDGEDEANGLNAAIVHIIHLDELWQDRLSMCG